MYFNYIYKKKYCFNFLIYLLLSRLGIMLNRQSPPISTPLEPCRIAPYVNLATIRSVGGNAGGNNNGFKHAHLTAGESVENKCEVISSSLPLLRQVSGKTTMSAFDRSSYSICCSSQGLNKIKYCAGISNNKELFSSSMQQLWEI